ncbi:hypothetical protein ACFSCW_16105 [Sphingomonas tabacisoli]|uniref:Uncharacterized protein n=1 Tax=Sphingomonas tabacisoli TaxID=2249466 RepID=A0ABW4I785_9SPHN
MSTPETTSAVPASATPKPAPSTPRDLVAVMLRAAEKLQSQPQLNSARALLERGGDQLVQLLDPERRPDWAWFEILFEEDACRLPEALLRAGRMLHREDFTACGIETLDWMLRGRVLAKCIDTMADACEAAFAATGDLKWLMISRTAILARRAHPRES